MLTFSQLWHLAASGGRPMAARVARWRRLANRIVAKSEQLKDVSDETLLMQAREIRWSAKSGVALNTLLPDAYALVRESARRSLGKSHYPVQIMGGIALFEGGIAEMQTGEGKTLTATLPTFLRALPGRGCHVVTVNDYLTQRDRDLMGPVYERLGLTVGCIVSDTDLEARRRAYWQDITYVTGCEAGFDFLRDRLKFGPKLDDLRHDSVMLSGLLAPQAIPTRIIEDGASNSTRQQVTLIEPPSEGPVQRGHYFALVDEADSVLIDDAGTPLIIGLNRENSESTTALLNWSRDIAASLVANVDFHFESAQRNCELTTQGVRKIILAGKPQALARFDFEKIYSHVEQALRARHAFHRGRDYVIASDDEIAIVDEGTGRIMEGRKWQAGLHQAIEAKESVPITAETGEAARITVQSFFRRYRHLAGMTGTAMPAARELRKTYHLGVTAIPTHRPCLRRGDAPRLFVSHDAKQSALIPEIERLFRAGRSILIGTPSVEASNELGQLLKQRGIECPILNALFHEQEAAIIAEAGQPGRVTIATNMAGRGTDIHLHDDVRSAGGLHIIATEMHTNRRIDRQLVGRAARQGDPGSFQFWLSLDDELFRFLTPDERARLRTKARPNAQGELPSNWLRVFRRTQRIIEVRERAQRQQQLLAEQQREKLSRQTGLDPYLELTE